MIIVVFGSNFTAVYSLWPNWWIGQNWFRKSLGTELTSCMWYQLFNRNEYSAALQIIGTSVFLYTGKSSCRTTDDYGLFLQLIECMNIICNSLFNSIRIDYGLLDSSAYVPQTRECLCNNMMTSSNGTIFRVTVHLCGEFTGPRWIPHTKASDAELWCLLWSAPE